MGGQSISGFIERIGWLRLLGPILVRNPYFTDYLVKDICNSLDVKYKANTNGMAYKAYDEYIKNFHGEQ